MRFEGKILKAVLYDRFGPPAVLELREVPEPVPRPGQVAVRVVAASVNPKDALVRSGRFRRMTGSSFPKRVGSDFAGTVAALGPGVGGIEAGDAVFGMLNGWAAGGCAEMVVAAAGELARKPESLSFIEAAALPLVGQTALQALRDLAGVTAGSRVCIHGAAGGVGTVAVQVARALGAHVTALCGAGSVDLVKGLGAHTVLDYRRVRPPSIEERFDCFFDVFGNQSFAALKHLLLPRGIYVTTLPTRSNILAYLRTLFWPGRRARLVVVKSRRRDLETLAMWVEEGRLKPVLAQVLPLAEIRRAHELIETRGTHGKIVLSLDIPE
ncbi:MAG TPA: NAD(P)-dependent alcohol dehydrogenase [Burkholderiales bacterium]|nr:NAD(P)-dependent alcohol dehydrogenase [Burkholderiales bacterium]